MEFEVTQSKFNFKKTLCCILAVIVAFACVQPGFAGFSAYSGNVTDGNVTDGNVTSGNVTGGNVTGGNVTDGNVTDGNVTDGNACDHEWILDEGSVIEPTCTEDGSQVMVCSQCGVSGELVPIPATGHTEVTDEAVAPTCTEKGLTEGSHCSVCNAVIVPQDEVPATGHTEVTDEAVASSCTETGLTQGSHCSVCNAVIVPQEEISATGHTSSDWIVDKASTCGVAGSKHKECTVCKAVLETEAIKKLPHAEFKWVVTKESTCTKTGKMHKECVDCKAKVEEYEISCRGHYRSEDWVVTKKATVNAKGSKCQKCVFCGVKLKTAVIPQLKCAAPKLKAVSNVATGIKFTWNKVTGADNYEIYRKTGNGAWKKLATVKGTVTTYTDKTAKSGTTYKYTVKAKNEAGLSKYNTTGLSIKCLADPVLKAPTSTKKGITLKWNKVTGAQGYVVYRKAGNGNFTRIATVKGVSKISYTDKKAKKGIKYSYKIKAYSGKIYSAQSNVKTIKDKF